MFFSLLDYLVVPNDYLIEMENRNCVHLSGNTTNKNLHCHEGQGQILEAFNCSPIRKQKYSILPP